MKDNVYQYIANLPLDLAGKFLRYVEVTKQSRIKVIIAALKLLFEQYEAYNGELVPYTPKEINDMKQARHKE